MLFSHIVPAWPSPTESKSLFFTSVSLFCLACSTRTWKLWAQLYIPLQLKKCTTENKALPLVINAHRLKDFKETVYIKYWHSTWNMKVKFTHSCPTLCDPMDSTVHGILQARILEWVAFSFSRGSSQPRDQTQVSHIAGDSLPTEPEGNLKNTGLHSLFLLLTQESNRGLQHCRQILYQLSGKPNVVIT